MDNPHLLIFATVTGLWLVSWITALVSINSDRVQVAPGMRGAWIAVAIVFPVVGPILWFIAGRPFFISTTPRDVR